MFRMYFVIMNNLSQTLVSNKHILAKISVHVQGERASQAEPVLPSLALKNFLGMLGTETKETRKG